MLPVYEIRKSDLTVKRNVYELSFPEHMHEYIEIVYTYRGVQNLKIENSNYSLTDGNLAVIFPNTLHSFNSDKKLTEKNDCEILILMCSPKLFGGLFPDLKSLFPENAVIPKSKINAKLRAALKNISPDDSFEAQFSWTCVIMSYIMELLSFGKRPSQPVDNITYKIMKYVEENFTEQITRELLSKKFNVSEGYISKIFTQNFKLNLRSYLGFRRAEYAANLIRTTNESFTAISQIAGFDSQRTFNRMFLAAYGKTPREYKNNINSK